MLWNNKKNHRQQLNNLFDLNDREIANVHGGSWEKIFIGAIMISCAWKMITSNINNMTNNIALECKESSIDNRCENTIMNSYNTGVSTGLSLTCIMCGLYLCVKGIMNIRHN